MDISLESLWVVIVIHNISSKPIKLMNLKPNWGKLHADGNKSVEVKASDYEGKIVEPNEKLQFNACGRSDASSGTDGSFELVDPSEGDKLIRHFYWSCPYGNSGNQWITTGSNSKWIVESSGQNESGRGALGNVTTEVFKKGA